MNECLYPPQHKDGMGVDEELAWGTILADAARHIARALHPKDLKDEAAALLKIFHTVSEELGSPISA